MSDLSGRFGLTDDELQQIIQVLKKFPEVHQAAIFGSRALGTYKRGSDIDLVLYGDELNTTPISFQLNEEGLLPYFFDILDYQSLANPELKNHIDRVAISFYKS